MTDVTCIKDFTPEGHTASFQAGKVYESDMDYDGICIYDTWSCSDFYPTIEELLTYFKLT